MAKWLDRCATELVRSFCYAATCLSFRLALLELAYILENVYMFTKCVCVLSVLCVRDAHCAYTSYACEPSSLAGASWVHVASSVCSVFAFLQVVGCATTFAIVNAVPS